ncbi:crotonase/enoyl-CoA hydratase family protein [Nocardia vinacea]|uniref:Crotonase/enoyl-CoA hydratase family protein n=1 Tax=Nocardia vinacea TaxID=96468 RepID=A0ABZ1YWI3_9NOCA|nr:crotonase/enoyl-CoA hydratase family protein [Nocardia vinacea]
MNLETTRDAGDEVLTDVRGRVLVITLNRPAAVNAIDTALVEGLTEAVGLLDSSDDLAVGILTGGPKAFCSGMDLKAFAKMGLPKGLHEFYANGSRKPLIAALEGPVLAGGFELALTCDIMVASATAKFGIPEVKVGLFAAGGGLIRLPRRVGHGMAMEMALTGDQVDAQTAYRIGLVNHLTEAGQSLGKALEIADRVARNAPLSVAASKELIQAEHTHSEESFWALQRPLIRTVFRSEDAKEGPRAFAQKRLPEWRGR